MKQEKKIAVNESFQLPSDVTLGDSIITIKGNHEILIENYKSIIEYTENKVVVQTKQHNLILLGKKFLIQYFTNDDMKIMGYLYSIQYE